MTEPGEAAERRGGGNNGAEGKSCFALLLQQTAAVTTMRLARFPSQQSPPSLSFRISESGASAAVTLFGVRCGR